MFYDTFILFAMSDDNDLESLLDDVNWNTLFNSLTFQDKGSANYYEWNPTTKKWEGPK